MSKLKPCRSELLYRTSRYYSYTERALAGLARRPEFCMAGYTPHLLTQSQRDEMSKLTSKTPSWRTSRRICKIIESAIK